jgi:anti-anti-sigma regulatory factor
MEPLRHNAQPRLPEIGAVVRRDGLELAIVELNGDHHDFTSPRLGATLEAVLREGRSLVVDMRRTVFIDDTTVSCLLAARLRAADAGRGFAVVVAPSTGWSVRRLVAATRLERLLPVVPSLERALEVVREPAGARAERH